MRFLIRIFGTKGKTVDGIIHMHRDKVKTFKELYETCQNLKIKLEYEEKFKITSFEIIQYNKNDEYIYRTSFKAFSTFMAKENKYPKNLKEIYKYH